MLTGLTYEEEVKVEKQISQETAETVVQELQKTGVIDDCGVVNKEVAVETINLSSVPEPVKKEIIETIRQEKPVTVASLSQTTYTETKVEKVSVSYEEAVQIMEDLKGTQVIDSKGKIKDTMKAELVAGTLNLSDRWSKAKQRAVLQALNKADNKPVIRDASKEVTVKLKKKAILSPEFMELWNKIKQKTTYRVQFDLDTLVENSIKEIKEMPEIGTARLLSQTARVNIEKSGVSHQAGRTFIQDLTRNYETLPDILRLISTKTLLKRSTVNRILQESGRIADFLKNPQEFYEKTLEIIERNRHKLAIDGIKYIKLADEEYYVQEIFDSTELIANLDKNAVAVENSVYDHVIYDSGIESKFALALDKDPDVKMFFKIPSRFKIETPIGTYNPDWAVYLEKNGEQKLYFVLETKGTDNLFLLREEEKLKIMCGAEHFKALDGVGFSKNPVREWQEKLTKEFTLPVTDWSEYTQETKGLCLMTYDEVIKNEEKVSQIVWDLAVFDEADFLFKPDNKSVATIKKAVGNTFKLLLTPTPITLSIMDIYGLIHFIDETLLPDADSFYKRYFRKPENYPELSSWISKFAFRTLKRQVEPYVNFTKRLPVVLNYTPQNDEKKLYNLTEKYLALDNKTAYPQMDNYQLALQFYRTLSSSPQAFANMLSAPIERASSDERIILQTMQKMAFNTDIDIIKMRSSRQKAVLEQTLETLRQETSKIKESIGSAKDRLEELKIQKQINEKEKQLRKKEEGLFFEQMRIEAIAEEQIEQLCATNNIEIKLSLVFKVKI